MYELNPLNYTVTNRATATLGVLQAGRATAIVGVADLIKDDRIEGVTSADSLAQTIAREIHTNMANLAVPLKGQTIDLETGQDELTARTDPFIGFLNDLPDTDFTFKKRVLLEAIGIYNPNTRVHSLGVAAYAHVIGSHYISPLAVPLRAPDLELLALAGQYHDFGKIAVPLTITRKDGKLDGEEYEIMKMHQIIGYFILSKLRGFERAAEVMKHCHFYKGYPEQFYGERKPPEITPHQHILIMADIIEALRSSKRAYRDVPLPWDKVIAELRKNQDPSHPEELIEIVERVLAKSDSLIITDPT